MLSDRDAVTGHVGSVFYGSCASMLTWGLPDSENSSASNDNDLAVVLVHVSRRLPSRGRSMRGGGTKELTLQPLGLVDQLTSLGPHPPGGIICS